MQIPVKVAQFSMTVNKRFSMDDAQALNGLKGLSDGELEKAFQSLWTKYPLHLVRDELILRLRLNSEISMEA